jgi:hypothetical protein
VHAWQWACIHGIPLFLFGAITPASQSHYSEIIQSLQYYNHVIIDNMEQLNTLRQRRFLSKIQICNAEKRLISATNLTSLQDLAGSLQRSSLSGSFRRSSSHRSSSSSVLQDEDTNLAISSHCQINALRRGSSGIYGDTKFELKRLSSRVSFTSLLTDEIARVTKKRNLVFPEAPGHWDMFWIGLLAVFVLSVIPGLFKFASRSFPFHWEPTGTSMVLEDMNTTLRLYKTAGYGIVTPLSKPMPSYFILHVLAGCLASLLLLVLFSTGRVMRWRLANGSVDYDSAEDLHKLAALASSFCWTVVIVTGAITIPLLHPTLQMANYAELCGVVCLFVGALSSAYFRQWVLHRLFAWGLIYSAVASIFVGVSGRSLQAWTGMTAYEIKAIGYAVAFLTPILGLIRDLLCEVSKMYSDYDALVQRIGADRQRGMKQTTLVGARPFQAARGDKMRRLSLWQHLRRVESREEHNARRHSSIYYESSTEQNRHRVSYDSKLTKDEHQE